MLGQVAVMDEHAVKQAVQRGRTVQPQWAATSFAQRRKVLRALLAEIVARQDEICRLAIHDSGKTLVDAAMGEVFPVCEKLRYTIAHGENDLRPQRRSAGFLVHKTAKVVYEPLGVVGVIAPWNFPFHNLMCPLIPALFAGNAVVVKVSELASWSSLAYLEMIHDVLRQHGHPVDLVQIVTGYGPTGAALVDSGVDKVFFTGSPQNGRSVMQTAAKSLTPVVLELGGKDAFIVCADADVERALDAAMLGVFTACGQMCVAAERFYVVDAVYDEFVRGAIARAENLRQGQPLDTLVDMGAITMARQVDIVDELVADALDKGARAVVGGHRRPELGPHFYAPTVLVDVDHSMRITQEETFGPVMVIVRARDEEHAIELANECPYGLGSSVFTRDRARGERMANRLRAGMSVVNDYGLAYMMQSLPFGGTKVSGFGRINGREGLRECCNVKAVVNDRLPWGKAVAVHPIREQTYDLVESTVRLIYSRGLKRRVKAAVDAARSVAALVRSHTIDAATPSVIAEKAEK
jgi:acyl-CoA reductase-like NAD-dependent aldehyde dehydrogenase